MGNTQERAVVDLKPVDLPLEARREVGGRLPVGFSPGVGSVFAQLKVPQTVGNKVLNLQLAPEFDS